MRCITHQEDTPVEIAVGHADTHSFDAGTASGYMALQALRMGWSVHGMAGFDRQRLNETLNIPEGYSAEAGFAIGRLGDPVSLPASLRERERPSDRLPLSELSFEGGFPADH
ncbi:nitroreductase family protein [Sphingomonas sp. LB2R24]|uniref:nitroreductase family protein n=1 Tax=Sphingomonas sorbitolis TaxID=3096165 RepID=UPI002FC74CC0